MFSSCIRLSFTALKKMTVSLSELTRSRDSRMSSKAGHVRQRWLWDSTIVSSRRCLQNWQFRVSFLYLESSRGLETCFHLEGTSFWNLQGPELKNIPSFQIFLLAIHRDSLSCISLILRLNISWFFSDIFFDFASILPF